MEKSWTVVKFIEENSVEAVPTSWIVGDSCYWPPLTQTKILVAIKNHESPSTCWPTHKISFFRNGTFETYLEARRKCKIAECVSDLQSEDDSLRQRKIRNKKVISSSSSSSTDEEEYLKDPPLPKNKIVPLSAKMNHGSDDEVLKMLTEDFKTFTTQCLRKQNMLTNMVADLITEVAALKKLLTEAGISQQSDISDRGHVVFDKLNLPANNIEEMNAIEHHLLSDDKNFMKAVQQMSRVGGNSPFEFVKRVMLQLMTYQTATLYTWHGTAQKAAFKNLKISQMILGASEGMGTQKQIEEALQKFFRRAKERCTNNKN